MARIRLLQSTAQAEKWGLLSGVRWISDILAVAIAANEKYPENATTDLAARDLPCLITVSRACSPGNFSRIQQFYSLESILCAQSLPSFRCYCSWRSAAAIP